MWVRCFINMEQEDTAFRLQAASCLITWPCAYCSSASALHPGTFQRFANPTKRILWCEHATFSSDPRRTSDQTSQTPAISCITFLSYFSIINIPLFPDPTSRANSSIAQSPPPLSLPSIIPKTAKHLISTLRKGQRDKPWASLDRMVEKISRQVILLFLFPLPDTALWCFAARSQTF